MNDLGSLFSHNPFFNSLSQETLDELSRLSQHRTLQEKETIVHQEDIWAYLFVVAKGRIHAVKESAEGRTLIAATLQPGDIFWGLAFFVEGMPMPVRLQADSEAEIFIWSRERILPIILENGEMAWALNQVMVNRMQRASGIVESLAFNPVMSRLAGLLLEIFGDAEDEFKARDLTLEDMAAHIGTTREMVCRHLYRLAEEGAIEISRTELRICDRHRLESQITR
jgi:CRP/FNR family cyclic AMP-dependent transcriptional regulator